MVREYSLTIRRSQSPAMHARSDVSLRGVAPLVAEVLLKRLDLSDVTLVGRDTGGALVQLVAGHRAARVRRTVLVSCDL